MSASPDTATRARRWLRWAAFASLAWAVVRAFFLVPLFDGPGPVAAWIGPLLWAVAPFVLLATALLRGTITIGLLLGAYGVYSLVLAGAAWVRVFTGAAAADPRGPGVVWWATVIVPFALVWVRGGWAAWGLLSRPSPTGTSDP